MRNYKSELSSKDVLSLYDSKDIVHAILCDEYYNAILVGSIKDTFKDMDNETKDFYSDLNDTNILVSAFRDHEGDHEIVSMMQDAGFGVDIARLIDNEYDVLFYEPDYKE